MNSQERTRGADAGSGNGVRRLDSWKAIATYLQRDVRTVQRWHQRGGLPVHRHADPQQRGVFAFEDELAAWANELRRDSTGEPESEIELPAAGGGEARRRLSLPVAVAAGFLVLTGSRGVWLLQTRAGQAVPFKQRDWLLVAAIDNRTGDNLLENTLQYALEQEIKASSFVNVVPRERIRDVVLLMRRPESTVLTPEVAREVAVRDGDIQAIVTGRVEAIGHRYVLSLQIVDPQTGAALRAWTHQASSQTAVLEGVRTLSLLVRGTLGEHDASSREDARLPRVTTSSLDALRLYEQAEQALAGSHARVAQEFLESALRSDPDFASAHMRLVDALSREADVRASDPRLAEHLDRAFALSSNLAEEERLRILSFYHYFRAEYDKDMAVCEALVRLRPDDWEPHHNLGVLYGMQQRTRESIAELERAAALRPNDFRRAVWAARALATEAPDRARPYMERARMLWPTEASQYSAERMGILPAGYTRDAAWILLYPAYERWRARDLRGMLDEIKRVLDSEPLAQGSERDAFLTIAMALSMTAGRLTEARELAERMFGEQLREVQLAVVADAIDDLRTVRTHLSRFPDGNDGRPLRYVRAGLYKQAAEILTVPSLQGGPHAAAARAEIAIHDGRHAEAIELLRKAIEMGRGNRLSERYLAAESLATELQRSHRPDEAIKVLEEAAADEPRYSLTGTSGAYWLRVLGRLAREYRASGRHQDAERIEQNLRELLAIADADHPLVIQLAKSPIADARRERSAPIASPLRPRRRG
jgi:tetratricopeptide (TPR) repeat protein